MGAEPSEVFSKTPAINRGIPRVVHFVNCVGLTPLVFSGVHGEVRREDAARSGDFIAGKRLGSSCKGGQT